MADDDQRFSVLIEDDLQADAVRAAITARAIQQDRGAAGDVVWDARKERWLYVADDLDVAEQAYWDIEEVYRAIPRGSVGRSALNPMRAMLALQLELRKRKVTPRGRR